MQKTTHSWFRKYNFVRIALFVLVFQLTAKKGGSLLLGKWLIIRQKQEKLWIICMIHAIMVFSTFLSTVHQQESIFFNKQKNISEPLLVFFRKNFEKQRYCNNDEQENPHISSQSLLAFSGKALKKETYCLDYK